MNALIDLPREALPLPKPEETGTEDVIDQILDNSTKKLANDAKSVLNYVALSSKVSAEQTKHDQKFADIRNRTKLAAVLLKLEIKPFKNEAVEQYKEAQLQKTNLWQFRAFCTILCLAVLFVLSVLGWFISNAVSHWFPFATTFGHYCAITAGGSLVVIVMIFLICFAESYTEEWHKTEISNYTQPVPEFVLRTAVDIKQEVPDAKIYIDHLSKSPDPFLVVVVCEDEPIYLEHWNEPDYKAGRQV